jgi:hypothetical protein
MLLDRDWRSLFRFEANESLFAALVILCSSPSYPKRQCLIPITRIEVQP